MLARARQLFNEEKYAAAADAFRKLRDEFPEHDYVRSGDAQFYLGACLSNAGKTEEEIDETRRFLKEYPEHGSCAYALYFLGLAYQKLGDEEKARQAWEELLEKYPDDDMAEYATKSLTGELPAAAQSGTKPEAHVRLVLGTDFIDFAEGAATWLMSIAVKEDGGLKWPEYEGTKAHRFSFYDGSSGICLFFLNMFRITGEDEYREHAERAASLLMRRAIKVRDALYWQDERENNNGTLSTTTSPALYVGTAGIGCVFLDLWQVTGNAEYLEYARGAANWIVAAAHKDDPLRRWDKDTDIISGAAGTGLFLLETHKATGESRYLDCAEGAGQWLISVAVKDGDGLKWKSTTTLDRFYTGFSHGTAGNAYYLAKLYEATSDTKYLDAAEAGAKWLVRNAVAEQGGLKWFHYEPEHTDSFMTGWCHGPAGTCRLFLELHRLTKKDEYLDIVRKGAAWLMATMEPSDTAVPFHGLSMCCGAAGIGDFFLDAYGVTHDDAYLEYAARIGEHLMLQAKQDHDGTKWTNYDRPDEEGNVYYATGHMTGAAGIGSFMLRLHAFCNCREAALLPFADKPAAKRAEALKRAEYVVLTNLDENDKAYQAAKTLAAHRQGVIVSFDPEQMTALGRKLVQLQPRYVALVLKPQDIDVNLHRRVLAISTRMDVDPFSDFAFGFITGKTSEQMLAFVERIIATEKDGLPKTMISTGAAKIRSCVLEGSGNQLAARLGYTGKHIYWGYVKEDPNTLDFVRKHIKDLQHHGIIDFMGCGDPEGIWLFGMDRNSDESKHWPFDPEKVGWDPNGETPRITAEYFKGLDLSPAVVWAGTCHVGVPHRAFVENDIVSTFGRVEHVTEYIIPEGRSLCLAILSCGPTAFLAPIGANHSYSPDVEEYRALATGWPLGDVMRSRYNEIILAAGGELDIQLYVPGAPPLDEDPMRGGGANRLLYGDPLYAPFAATGNDYLKKQVTPVSVRPGFVLKCEVVDEDCTYFWDMFGTDNDKHPDRIYTTVEVPAKLTSVVEVTAIAQTPEGEEIPVTECTWGVERIDGKHLLHLQVNAARDSFRKNGTIVEFTVLASPQTALERRPEK